MEKNMLWYNQFMGKKRRSREFRNNSQVIDMDEARKKRQAKRREEKAREEEKARKYARQHTAGKMAIRRQKRRRKILTGLIIVGIIGAMSLSLVNIISLKKEQHDVLAEQEQLKQQKQELQKELENISDSENIEEQARNQLRLIRPGETLYMLPDEITDKDTSTDSSKDQDE
ncbi:MAG: septum formation initiator family protein [Lentihominibacter sp.]|nr:septum formation initiator family protein [Clostridiales bacterium]MDY2680386.1 septum formation initiator family protein [Lentihominibacter sp.]